MKVDCLSKVSTESGASFAQSKNLKNYQSLDIYVGGNKTAEERNTLKLSCKKPPTFHKLISFDP